MSMVPILILNSYDLTFSEEYIAKEINNNPSYFFKNSITVVASQFGVATATISRLAKKIGYKNFKEFKLFIYEKYMQIKNSFNLEQDGELSNLVQKIKNFNIYSISETVSNLNLVDLTNVIDCILKSTRIYVFGVGASGIVAGEMCNNLCRLGFNAHSSTDFHGQLLFVNSFKENELLILISTSGTTREIIELIKLSKKNNYTTLLITAKQDKEKMVQPNYKLHYYVHYDESAHFPIIASKISQFMICDILISILIKNRPDQQQEIEKGKQIIINWNKNATVL